MAVFSIFFPNHAKLGTSVLYACRSQSCFPSHRGSLDIRFQNFVTFLNRIVNHSVSWIIYSV